MAKSSVKLVDATKNTVGNGIQAARGSWSFAGNVADSFVDHISNSVPLYEFGHEVVCRLSDFFVKDGSVCYELGVSTGELIRKLAKFHEARKGIRWVGIDCEQSMIDAATKHCKDCPNIELIKADLAEFPLERSNFIVSYYCLQFVPPRFRQDIYNRVFESLHWGGAFVFFEKVRAPDARFQDITTALYDDFKTERGFSDVEIMSKKRSLRGILEPYTTEAHLDFLHRAGFKDVMSVVKCISFEGFLAIK
jgi:tRNA (cmo5U34)-methyltransferase